MWAFSQDMQIQDEWAQHVCTLRIGSWYQTMPRIMPKQQGRSEKLTFHFNRSTQISKTISLHEAHSLPYQNYTVLMYTWHQETPTQLVSTIQDLQDQMNIKILALMDQVHCLDLQT